MMTQNEVLAVFQQIQFFNKHFHASENQLNSNDFRELMRTSKDRCQLMLLKFASPEMVWVKLDPNSTNKEWSVGVYGLPDGSACHIPLHTLQQGLSDELLETWQIS